MRSWVRLLAYAQTLVSGFRPQMAALVLVSKQIEHFEYRKDLPGPVHTILLLAKLLPGFRKKDIHHRLAPA